jgi:hypothetical protein
MRLISTEPEFSMSGSAFIAGAFGIAATSQAVALVALRRHTSVVRGAGRIVGLAGMLPLFLGGGAVMLPTVIGGGLAVGQRDWPGPLRAFAAVVALAPIVAVSASLVDDFGLSARLVAGIAGLLVVYGGVVSAVSASLGKAPDARPLPRVLLVAIMVFGVLVLLIATVGFAGIRRG